MRCGDFSQWSPRTLSMRQRFVYRQNGECRTVAVPFNGVLPSRHEGTLGTMEERVLKDLHQLECEQGSRFNGVGEFSPAVLKKVWAEGAYD